MTKSSAKSKAREFFRMNPQITIEELLILLDDEVLGTTVEKYLIEFRKTMGKDRGLCPDTISMSKLEKELAVQLERNPNSSVIKSCIDFLKLKQMSDELGQEIDMEQFIKKGKDLYN